MRKLIICAIAALFMAPLTTSAQTEHFVVRPVTETTQSVSLAIPMGASLHYAYERPFARRATIIARIGAEVGGEWGYNMFSGSYGYWAITPSIDIEPRWYYGLDRRDANGRSTFGNAGSFLAVQIKNTMPFGYISDGNRVLTGATIVTPMWGLRRVWADHWLFEFTAGYSFAWGWMGAFEDSPHLGVRFGYSF